MSWEVEIEGTMLPQKFETEAEANQAAANARGPDWSKKIIVRDTAASGDASTARKPAPQPAAPVGVLEALAPPPKK